MIDPENAVSVAVERERFAKARQIALKNGEIAPGRFGLVEMQSDDSARCIVDEDQETAARPTVLKPGMLGAVDLDELAKALASSSRRMKLEPANTFVLPELRLDQ